MTKTRSEVLYFYGSNCPVCKTMAPFIDEAGETFEGRVVLKKINTATDRTLAAKYRVMAVPTTVAVSDGTEVTRIVGARTPGGLRRLFESAETGEALESGISPTDRGLRVGVAVGFAFWDKIRR